MKKFGTLLVYLGVICMAFATATTIIYTIYEWANVLPLAKALWEGAKLWLKLMGAGLGGVVLGIFVYIIGLLTPTKGN